MIILYISLLEFWNAISSSFSSSGLIFYLPSRWREGAVAAVFRGTVPQAS
jgi:hypothetical protein